VIVSRGVAYVSAQVGAASFASALAMMGALLGFLHGTTPRENLLGDGGAYLLGFWLGELSSADRRAAPGSLAVVPDAAAGVSDLREPYIRCTAGRSCSASLPDTPTRFHMHQVIYAYLHKAGDGN